MKKKVRIEFVKSGCWTKDGYEIREYWNPGDYYYCGSFNTREEAVEYAVKEGWEVEE